MLLTQIQRFKALQKGGCNVQVFIQKYVLGNRCQTLFLGPGCFKYHFSPVMPGKAGAFTDSALQEGLCCSLRQGNLAKASGLYATKYRMPLVC